MTDTVNEQRMPSLLVLPLSCPFCYGDAADVTVHANASNGLYNEKVLYDCNSSLELKRNWVDTNDERPSIADDDLLTHNPCSKQASVMLDYIKDKSMES